MNFLASDRWWIILTLAIGFTALASTSAHAGLLQTDLRVEMTVDPDLSHYPTGTLVEIEFTVENLGPDNSPDAVVQMESFTFSFGEQAVQVSIFPHSGTAPCDYYSLHLPPPVGGVGYETPQLFLGALPAGTSQTCSVLLLVEPSASGTYDLGAGIYNFSVLAIDPNLANNFVSRPMRVGYQGPKPIPGSSQLSQILLVVLVLLSATFSRRKT